MKSYLYVGKLGHRRFSPKKHFFNYPVALFYLDLDEINQIFSIPLLFSSHAPRFIGFNRNKYLKGKPSLKVTVDDLIAEKTGKIHTGPIRILTQVSYLGFCFNPVSFYYCFDENDKILQFIVVEVSNTPWNERKSYVIECEASPHLHRIEFKKDFHISPFLPMDLLHIWTFSEPKPELEKSLLSVYMEDRNLENSELVFDATLTLKPTRFSYWNLAKLYALFPLLTFKSFFAIYYEALRLKLKGIPFYPHPRLLEKKEHHHESKHRR